MVWEWNPMHVVFWTWLLSLGRFSASSELSPCEWLVCYCCVWVLCGGCNVCMVTALLRDVWVVSTLGPVCVQLLWILLHGFFCECETYIFWDRHAGASGMFHFWFCFLRWQSLTFSKWLFHFMSTAAISAEFLCFLSGMQCCSHFMFSFVHPDRCLMISYWCFFSPHWVFNFHLPQWWMISNIPSCC